MRTIYQPTGRAREYAELALNIYEGCTHGCKYCFNRFTPWHDKQKFMKCQPRPGIIEALRVAAAKMAGDPREILLCFTCDPYPWKYDCTTRMALVILEQNMLNATILTKAGEHSTYDFDILSRNNWSYGTSIGLHSEVKRKFWEPEAAPFSERLECLIKAKTRENPIRTWVSVEPVIDAQEALECMEWCAEYVDFWKVGKLNYASRVAKMAPEGWKEPDWPQFLKDVKKFLKGKPHMIKKDLAQYE